MARPGLPALPDGPPVVRALLGPTNTGKTHRALEAMLQHPTGMIGLPLRLLAREVYDRLTARVGEAAVALVTGEERRVPPRPRYWVCTVEAMPVDREVDFLAVDEVQLAGDPGRGHVFTDRLLYARGARETLFLGSDTVAPLLRRLVPEVAVESHPRLSRLAWVGPRGLGSLPPRSAVVTFSAERVYAIAELVRRKAGGAAVVMGALSPRTRNAQVAMFQAGEVPVLVATDAIGMGLNLDLSHVAFADGHKFDGERTRLLTAAEVGQIAGRAGRYTNDGTFGVTDTCPPFGDGLVEQVERQRFPPLKRLWWRPAALDASSLEALRRSLHQTPPAPFLERVRADDDEGALEALSRHPEVRARATTPAAVGLLWEVCRVPDYRGLAGEAHPRLLLPVYLRLHDRGVLPTTWVERQIDALDRVDGDIAALMGRVAAIRTWAYVAHRPGWTEDPVALRAHAGRVEERLSDALHQALTERFVDRRSVTAGAPAVGALEGGRVRVGGEVHGEVVGLQFRPRGGAEQAVGRAVREVVAPEVARRAERAAAAEHAAFTLDAEAVIAWEGAPVARLVAGPDPREPGVKLVRNDWLAPGAQMQLQRRLSAWVRDHVAELLAPLRREDVPRGPARGVLYALERALGTVPTEAIADLVPELRGPDRAGLARAGVRLGVGFAWSQPLLERAADRAVLWAVHAGGAVPPLPAPPADDRLPDTPDRFYVAVGYVPLGPRVVRVDHFEAAWAEVRQAARGGAFTVPPAFAGLGEPAAVAAMLRELGFQPAGDRWVRGRGRGRG